MKFKLLILVFLLKFPLNSKAYSEINPIGDLRTDLGNILLNKQKIEQYIQLLQNNSQPVAIAYTGILKTAMANQVKWPFSKLEYFNAGKACIENAVKKDPSSVEIRYIRILVQCNAPSFLAYNSNINTDTDLILSNLTVAKSEFSPLFKLIINKMTRLSCINEQSRKKFVKLQSLINDKSTTH